VVQQLRWDRADLLLYYNSTGLFFSIDIKRPYYIREVKFLLLWML